MLKSYPDYGKSPPEYLAGIVSVFAEYPIEIQQKLFNPLRGIRSKCAFLPTIADIVKLADEFLAKASSQAEFETRFSRPFQTHAPARIPFEPFPQLWAAFADERELLERRSFDALNAACKALVVYGKLEAKTLLQQSSQIL